MTSPTTAADRLDIAAVIARHHFALDRGDTALLDATVVQDARIAALADPVAPDGTSTITREHVLRNALIAVEGDRATVVGELGLVELELLPSGGAVRRQRDATSIDLLIRTPEGWRLAERTLHLADVDEAEVIVPADRRVLIEQGPALLSAPAFLGASNGGGGTPSQLLDIEAALASAAFDRDRAADALSSRHLISNVKAEVDGERARAESEFVRTSLRNGSRRRESGVERTELERTSEGWRIGSRTEFVKSDVTTPASLDEDARAAIVAATTFLSGLRPPRPAVVGPVADARVEIRELLIRYSSAFDQERWHLVPEVFLADAVLAGSGTADVFVAQAKALYHDRLTGLHSIAEPVLRVEGDRAWGYTDFTTIAIHEPADGDPEHLDRLRSGGFYVDELRRTEAGWRIARRDVAFSSSVRDTIDGGPALRESIARTRAELR